MNKHFDYNALESIGECIATSKKIVDNMMN